MSTLKVNNITDLGDDAVVTSGVLDTLAVPTGGILQVVSTAKTDPFTTTSLTFTPITGLSASITPTSTSSKIMVFVDLKATVNASDTNSGLFRLVRASTPIYLGDSAGSRLQVSALSGSTTSSRNTSSVVMNFLDSPATTSATTYSVEVRSADTGKSVFVNRTLSDDNDSQTGRTAISITLMEVAG